MHQVVDANRRKTPRRRRRRRKTDGLEERVEIRDTLGQSPGKRPVANPLDQTKPH